MALIEEHTEQLDGQPVYWRSAPTPEDVNAAPVLYLHGVPTSSDDWVPFLQRTGGLAPDLPGFGRTGKRGDGDFTIAGYEHFIGRFLELTETERVRLVVHDWGVVGLLWAMRNPERVERLVVISGVPLLPGYRWHRFARMWRMKGVGEVLMGSTNRWTLKLLTRGASGTPGPMPDEFLDQVMAYFDPGTQRAILQLYRTSPESVLAGAGLDLGELRCPALVVWGERDPYLPPALAAQYAAALGGPADVRVLPGVGHWPWLERPELVDEIAAYLE